MSVAIITGASGGIGSEFARQISRLDGIDEMWLIARNEERMIKLGEELGLKYKVISADLTTAEGIEKVRTALREEAPRVKFLVNASGFGNYELRKYGVRATCFCPGWVDTEFLGKSLANGNTHPKSMKPLLKCEDVVRRCVKASLKGRVMCVTNWYTKLQHLMFKLLPDKLLTGAWLGMLVKDENKDSEE